MATTIKKIDVVNVMTKANVPGIDYAINPYVGCAHACKYCYASFMKRITNQSKPWGAFIDVKIWPTIQNPSRYAGKIAVLGSVTDCYQPCEEKYGRTRELLKQLQGSGIRLTIVTKSDLVIRDIDLIKTLPNALVAFSINTRDEKFRCEMDHAVDIKRRIAAMRKLYDAGIKTACAISPIFPGLTDPLAIIRRVKDRCNLIWLESLGLRGGYKTEVLNWLQKRHPELKELYDDIYVYGDRSYWKKLDAKLDSFATSGGYRYMLRSDGAEPAPFGEKPVILNDFSHELVKRPVLKRQSSIL